jgi:hypothetical protein
MWRVSFMKQVNSMSPVNSTDTVNSGQAKEMAMSGSTRSRFLGVLFVLALAAALWASPAGAATLTWDANGVGDGQPDDGRLADLQLLHRHLHAGH